MGGKKTFSEPGIRCGDGDGDGVGVDVEEVDPPAEPDPEEEKDDEECDSFWNCRVKLVNCGQEVDKDSRRSRRAFSE